MRHQCTIQLLFLLSILLTCCQKVERPLSLVPDVSVFAAENITYTTAQLKGEVKRKGNETIDEIAFYVKREGGETMKIEVTDSATTACNLEGLEAESQYSYYLEVRNKVSSHRSEVRTFATRALELPKLSNIELLNLSPMSCSLRYRIEDFGGSNLVETGIYITDANHKETKIILPLTDRDMYVYRITELTVKHRYEVLPYAVNKKGEQRGNPVAFTTDESFVVTQPGMLEEMLNDSIIRHTERFVVSGPLNGTDFRLIRRMLGSSDNNDGPTGKLTTLNLRDAKIVQGGLSYDNMRFTQNDVISQSLFKGAPYLKELVLPATAATLESDALENLPQLERLMLPSALRAVAPSAGLPRLQRIEVPLDNPYLSGWEGAVYDQQGRKLYWMPEGILKEPMFPETLEEIGAGALKKYPFSEVRLPERIHTIGPGAFVDSRLRVIVLPDALESVSNYLFQGCKELESVTIGANVSQMGSYCFDGAPLRHLYVKVDLFLPMCDKQTFTTKTSPSLFQSCILHVPTKSMTKYHNHVIWGMFEQISGF